MVLTTSKNFKHFFEVKNSFKLDHWKKYCTGKLLHLRLDIIQLHYFFYVFVQAPIMGRYITDTKNISMWTC